MIPRRKEASRRKRTRREQWLVRSVCVCMQLNGGQFSTRNHKFLAPEKKASKSLLNRNQNPQSAASSRRHQSRASPEHLARGARTTREMAFVLRCSSRIVRHDKASKEHKKLIKFNRASSETPRHDMTTVGLSAFSGHDSLNPFFLASDPRHPIIDELHDALIRPCDSTRLDRNRLRLRTRRAICQCQTAGFRNYARLFGPLQHFSFVL
jgi:hypothetical protein